MTLPRFLVLVAFTLLAALFPPWMLAGVEPLPTPLPTPSSGSYGVYGSGATDGNEASGRYTATPGNASPMPEPTEDPFANRDFASLYVVNADGSIVVRLGEPYFGPPIWSPDGAKLVAGSGVVIINADGFGTSRSGCSPQSWSPDGTRLAGLEGIQWDQSIGWLCVVRADGTGMTRLAQIGPDGAVGGWSPDGTKILFSSWPDVYVVNADGSDLVNLTRDQDGWAGSPVWSPGGTRVAFVGHEQLAEGNEDVWTVHVDGSRATRLTNLPGVASRPVWSPDGAKLAFTRTLSPGGVALGVGSVHVMNANGSGLQTLVTGCDPGARTDDCAREPAARHRVDGVPTLPAWSPDGTRLLFGAGGRMFVVSADGAGRIDLGIGNDPVWSPDGVKIAFISSDATSAMFNTDVHLVNADGTGKVRLITTPNPNYYLTWSPDGSKLAFASHYPSSE